MTRRPTGAPDELDVLVLGSGVAGLSAAVRLAAPMSPAGSTTSAPGTGLRVVYSRWDQEYRRVLAIWARST